MKKVSIVMTILAGILFITGFCFQFINSEILKDIGIWIRGGALIILIIGNLIKK